jgi:hypothetical protein
MLKRYFQIAVNLIICYACVEYINDELKFFNYDVYWLLRHNLINSLLWGLYIILLTFSILGIYSNCQLIMNRFHLNKSPINIRRSLVLISHKLFGIILIIITLTILVPEFISILVVNFQSIKTYPEIDPNDVYIYLLTRLAYFLLPAIYGTFLYIDGYRLLKNWPQQRV